MPGRLTGRGGPVRMWFSVAQRRQEGQEGRSGEGFWGNFPPCFLQAGACGRPCVRSCVFSWDGRGKHDAMGE